MTLDSYDEADQKPEESSVELPCLTTKYLANVASCTSA
ncbi:MAG: hypothetical protein ACJAYU_001014 [Bradymonadia bacterium]|jgi:hypothetical protein